MTPSFTLATVSDHSRQSGAQWIVSLDLDTPQQPIWTFKLELVPMSCLTIHQSRESVLRVIDEAGMGCIPNVTSLV